MKKSGYKEWEDWLEPVLNTHIPLPYGPIFVFAPFLLTGRKILEGHSPPAPPPNYAYA